jgi:hypothetical protein
LVFEFVRRHLRILLFALVRLATGAPFIGNALIVLLWIGAMLAAYTVIETRSTR